MQRQMSLYEHQWYIWQEIQKERSIQSKVLDFYFNKVTIDFSTKKRMNRSGKLLNR